MFQELAQTYCTKRHWLYFRVERLRNPTYRRLSDISSERRAHLVQLVVQLSGLFERVQAEGAAGVRLLVGVPLHLIDRFPADALEHFPDISDIFLYAL